MIDTISRMLGAMVLPVAFYVGIHWGGVKGLAAAWVVTYPLLTAISAIWVLPVIGVRTYDLLAAIKTPVLAGVSMYLVVKILAILLPHEIAAVIRLAMLVCAGGLVYGGYLLVFGREQIFELVNLMRKSRR